MEWIIAITVADCLLLVLLLLFLRRRTASCTDFVRENSAALKQVEEINGRYRFYPSVCFDLHHTYDTEATFDAVSCEDYLIYQLQSSYKQIRAQIDKTDVNRRFYAKYTDEIEAISSYGEFLKPSGRYPLPLLEQTEKKLIKQQLHPAPCTEFTLTVTLCRASMNEQMQDRKRQTFSPEEILPLIQRINNKRDTYYRDRDIWDALCRVERGKVSARMRVSIFERDGYRCRICGASDALEIDHIRPISKGGKSEPGNLQTLCHNCNVSKGNAVD